MLAYELTETHVIVAEAHGLYLTHGGEVWYAPHRGWVPGDPYAPVYLVARVEDVDRLAAEIRAAADWRAVREILDRLMEEEGPSDGSGDSRPSPG